MLPNMKVRLSTLNRIAALIWIGVGGMLLVRGWLMLKPLAETNPIGTTAWLVGGLILGAAKGRYVLWNTALRNRRRMRDLAVPRLQLVFAPSFWPLIALMIGAGVGLRALASNGYLSYGPVGALYVGIGAALTASSLAYWGLLPPPIETSAKSADPNKRPTTRGLLVVNLGTPDAAEPGAVRRYLREFLSDPRVVRLPRLLWIPILNLFVLPWRVRRVTRAYASIWTSQGSPLLMHTEALTQELAKELGSPWRVVTAMRYGRPSIRRGIELLAAEGLSELVVLPLFPQWSDTTSGTVQAAVSKALAQRRDGPALRMIPAYPADSTLLARQAELARAVTDGQDPELHVFSFHGLPESYVRAGDPYLAHCQQTARGLAAALGLGDDQWEMTFQSRFGGEPWLTPSTSDRVPELAREGLRRVAILTPGFPCDCLETLEEIGEQLKEAFISAGGETFLCVPCPNADPDWARALARLVRGDG
ncbi:MAG TPA: ferrochelatase [Planctomycetes bacterium]|nr:ferrochelatase [Planctomycetota bacterium]